MSNSHTQWNACARAHVDSHCVFFPCRITVVSFCTNPVTISCKYKYTVYSNILITVCSGLVNPTGSTTGKQTVAQKFYEEKKSANPPCTCSCKQSNKSLLPVHPHPGAQNVTNSVKSVLLAPKAIVSVARLCCGATQQLDAEGWDAPALPCLPSPPPPMGQLLALHSLAARADGQLGKQNTKHTQIKAGLDKRTNFKLPNKVFAWEESEVDVILSCWNTIFFIAIYI